MRHAPEDRRGRRRPYSYYDVPPIHMPHWKWLIVSYFFLGGLSAGSYVVATVAELFGHRDDRDTVRVGRYLALLAILPCPVLLILDLGRPERFFNMLRVVKLRSPMSIGTWGLLAYSGFVTLSAIAHAVHDGFASGRAGLLGSVVGLLRHAPTRLIGLLGAPFGFFVGGYTGVLLGATAVPIWAKNARLLGPLFLSSALASSCAAISLVLACLPGRRERALERLHRAETIMAMGDLTASVSMRLHSGPLIRPLAEGKLGRLYDGGALGLGIVLPFVLHLIGPRLGLPYRLVTVLASLSSLAGGFIVKYAVVMAGHASAADPAATFEYAGGEMPEQMESEPRPASPRP